MKTFKDLNFNNDNTPFGLCLDLSDLKLYSNSDNDASTKSNDTYNDNINIHDKVYVKKKLKSKSSFSTKKYI